MENTKFVSREEVAEFLNCSKRYISTSPHFQRLEIRLGGKLFYDLNQVVEMMKSQQNTEERV